MNAEHHPMRAWAEVDLGVIARNAERILDRNPGRALMGVIKADAYGHGAVPVARTLQRIGAAMAGVGDSREAIELIRAGIRLPIVILGAIVDGEMSAVVAHDIRSTIHSRDRMLLLAAEAERQGRVHKVHLKVDSGLGRLGMMPERAVEVAREIVASPWLRLEGLCTHFANNHLDHVGRTNDQMRVFRQVHQAVTAELGPITMVHCRNTAASWNQEVEDEVSNTIRVGAALYGIPGPTERPYPFEPAMTLKTQIIFLKDVPPGTPIGYNGHFVTVKTTRLATLPIGYNDGLPGGAADRGEVVVRGRRALIRGAVSMDYATIDVSDIPGVRVGDEVMVFGRGEQGELSLVELARLAGTTNYAVTCGIGKRVQRVYTTSAVPPRRGDELRSAVAET
ncbi:MAG: alanine racemase [Planctomycetes bacterium]|nr:alanine racemase [Planctomycetota bacterium]